MPDKFFPERFASVRSANKKRVLLSITFPKSTARKSALLNSALLKFTPEKTAIPDKCSACRCLGEKSHKLENDKSTPTKIAFSRLDSYN